MLNEAFPKIYGKMVNHDECRGSAGQLHLQSKKARLNETDGVHIKMSTAESPLDQNKSCQLVADGLVS